MQKPEASSGSLIGNPAQDKLALLLDEVERLTRFKVDKFYTS